MANKVDEIRQRNAYTDNFKAKQYYDLMHEDLLEVEEFFVFNLTFIYDVLKSGRFKGSKMLEIGSGPTVHFVASASTHFPTIVQSDLVEDNLEELKKWHNKEPDHFDWSKLLDIVAKVEGMDSDAMANREILSSRVRKSVKAVTKGDVLSDPIISLSEKSDPECSPPYDLVTAFGCLEEAATDFDTYVAILKRINNLLKPGGGIITAYFIKGGTWYQGSTLFRPAKLSLKDVATALTMAGFVNHDFRMHERSIEFGHDYDGLYCVAAEKQG